MGLQGRTRSVRQRCIRGGAWAAMLIAGFSAAAWGQTPARRPNAASGAAPATARGTSAPSSRPDETTVSGLVALGRAATEARAVATELIALLSSSPTVVRREVLWMLSEIGGDDSVASMATLLTDKEVREDARCALMRLPGRKATAALESAFATAPEEFKFALAESLRQRGEKVNGYPSQKLVPTRQTKVAQPAPK